MLRVTRGQKLTTAITGSYTRPLWYDVNLRGQSFKSALGDSLFREQYLDAVAAIINAQEAAGLDIVTDGDSRFDLAVGGKSWFFYPIERLGGIEGHRDTSRGWMQRHNLRPGHILWEVQEAYQPAVVTERLRRGPLPLADTLSLAHAADNVIIVARQGDTTKERAEEVRSTLEGLGVDRVSVVLTNSAKTNTYTYG